MTTIPRYGGRTADSKVNSNHLAVRRCTGTPEGQEG